VLLETPYSSPSQKPVEIIERGYFELSSFALKLYGRLCLATDRTVVAREAMARALKLNPFLFDAFETLAKIEGGNNNNSVGTFKQPNMMGITSRVFQVRVFCCWVFSPEEECFNLC
jgi:hypothetical protein